MAVITGISRRASSKHRQVRYSLTQLFQSFFLTAPPLPRRAKFEKLEGSFAILESSKSGSLLKKHLTRPVFERLKDKKTTFGSTLMDVIQSGIENLDSGVGVYAPDSESYTVFCELFDPIIEDYHGGFTKSSVQPPKTWGDPDIFGNLDPENKFIVSTRVRCGRSIASFPFNPCLNKKQYLEIEKVAKFAFESFQDELKGEYFPLNGMKKEVQKKLIDDHFLFKEGDRFLKSANANRFWPMGRGIFHNNNKTFLIWVNEEDHLRIISMEPGGDLGNVYKRLIRGVELLEKRISFSRHPRFGFLTFCPTNLGTTIRASVHIKLPKLASDPNKLKEVAEKYKLQIRGTAGEHTESEKGVYDISNKRRLGLTEFEAVQTMNDGIKQLIKIEKKPLKTD